MTSTGMHFVKRTEEDQDLADFLSSIDQLTAAVPTQQPIAASRGGRPSSSNRSPTYGADLFFGSGSTFPGRKGGNSSPKRANATRSGIDSKQELQQQADWLKDFQSLEGDQVLAAPATAQNPAKIQNTAMVTEGRAAADAGTAGDETEAFRHGQEQQEVLGQEPEILDGDLYVHDDPDEFDDNVFTPAATTKRSQSTYNTTTATVPVRAAAVVKTSQNHVPTGAGSGGLSPPQLGLPGRASAGQTLQWPPPNSDTPLQAEPPKSATVGTLPAAGPRIGTHENGRLDWPGTLDMLGLEESDGRPPSNARFILNSVGPGGAKAPPSGKTLAADLPLSEAARSPSAVAPPAPVGKADSYPDFVELRDSRSVSQWPKPGPPGSSSSAGGGGAGTGAGRQGLGAAGTGKQQQQQQQREEVLPAPLRTVEVYLRPDVTWDAVSDVYMAVMLSRGLIVREQTDKMVSIKCKAVGGDGIIYGSSVSFHNWPDTGIGI